MHADARNSGLSMSAALVTRISAGEREAEEELVRTYGRRVNAIATARTRDPEIARDLTQDVLLAVIQAARASKIREPDKIEAFIQGTAKNVINSYFRTRKRLSEVSLETMNPYACDAVLESEAAERRRLVRQELSRCSVLDQRILLLSLVDGLSLAEVGRAVSISHDAVRARKSRLIKKMTERFGKMSHKSGLEPPSNG